MASAPNTEAHSDFSATTEKPLAHDSRQPSPISDKHSDTSKTHNGEDIVSSEAKQPAGEEIPTEDESNHAHGVKLALIVASMCMAVFLVALDQTIIAPALGAITAEYKSVKDIGWYGSAYLLTTTALQPMFGTVYKMFNVKLVYLGAIFIFEVGSLVSAAAPSSVAFIVGRAIAGIGTAGLFSGSIVILSLIMPLHRRPAFFGLIGGMWGIASVAGPLLGGAFTQGATWRWCFYINLPIGGLAMLIVFFFVKVTRNTNYYVGMSVLTRVKRLDLIGTAVFLPAIVCLLLALQWGGADYPWNSSKIIGLFVGFGIMICIFIGIQFWQGDQGTLPIRMFKNRNVVSSMFFCFFFGAAFFPAIYYLSLYFQAIQGVSAVQAGIKILPLLLACVLTSVLSGALITVIGYYNLVVLPAVVLLTVGCGLITRFDVGTPMREWFGFQVIAGLGVGPGFQIAVLVVQTVLTQEWVPVGTASVQFFQALGGAVSIAIAQTLFQNGLIDKIKADDIGIDPLVFINIGASEIKEVLTQMQRLDALDSVLEAYMKGLRNTYYLSTACTVCAFFAAASLEWKTVKKVDKKEPPAVAA